MTSASRVQHYVRPDGLPPVNGYSHAVAFTGRMVVVSGQVFLTDLAHLAEFRRVRDEFITGQAPPASSLVQVSGLVNPAFCAEIEALAAT